MNHYKQIDWWNQRSIDRNPLHNATNPLESIVEDISTDNNNKSYAARIFSAMPDPLKKFALVGTAAVTLFVGGCANKDEPIEPVDNPPIIMGYDIPDSVIVGEEFDLEVKARDDYGVKGVRIDIPSAGIEDMVLEKSNGSWTGTSKLTEEGTHQYTITVTDTNNQKAVEEGSIVSEANNLTDTEVQQLTGYLKELSRGWHQPSVDAANDILRDESLGPEVWESFFKEYFSQHAFTDDLRNYLGYPVYWWFSETAHANLQQGLYDSLTDIINSQTDAYLQGDKGSLTRDSPIVQSIMNSHRFLSDIIRLQAPGVEYRDDIFEFYKNLVKGNEIIYGNAFLDVDKYPFVGAFRAQAHMNLVDALDLTDPVSNQIIDILELTGMKKDIFYDNGVLVIDNQGLDQAQLRVVKSLLDSVPREMYSLTNITVNDFLGNTNNKNLWFLNKAGVNIFGNKVGTAKENSFPSDVSPRYTDGFSIVAAHELNHCVNADYIEKNDLLRDRQETLIKQAGADNLNYLRSMFDDDFFQNAPQEFFASISNQWFNNSEQTLHLGLERFNQGRVEPLNQFLFAAEVYSRGGSSTLFYTLDTSGNLTRREIPIVRDNKGRITEVHIGTKLYRFELDANGNVVSVVN